MEEQISSDSDRLQHLNLFLKTVLRHQALDLNLHVRDDGYVSVDELLNLGVKTTAGIPLSDYTIEDIKKVVEHDDKKRFRLLEEDGVLHIRANQGHSIESVDTEKLLRPISVADQIPVCIHGTWMKNLDSILSSGLKKMGRKHIHFATGLPNDNGVISGMSSDQDAIIYLDLKKALEDGMKLYMSDNGVVLTEGFDGVIPPKYFGKIAKWSRGKELPLDLTHKM